VLVDCPIQGGEASIGSPKTHAQLEYATPSHNTRSHTKGKYFMTTLFDPIRIGDLDLPNRIVMAPLTRSRAIGGQRLPNALMAEYYAQRASAGPFPKPPP
jgi:hypothetical protein